jgi:hypothetical protein
MGIITICQMGENIVRGAKGAKVKIIFQRLHMTHVFLLIYDLNLHFIPHLTLTRLFQNLNYNSHVNSQHLQTLQNVMII